MQQTAPKTKRRVILVLVLVGIAAAIYFGRGMVGGVEEQQAGGGVPVETAVVQAQPLDVTIDAVGSLVANEMVSLRPEIAGKITGINFTEGAPMKKGDALFVIDDRMARAELKQAESNLQLAKLNYARFQKLSSTGAATKQRYDEARAELGVNQANVDVARTRVDYMTIKAPFDGVVGLRKVSPGEYVNVGQELANFVSYDPMKVNFTIPETQASQLAVNQAIGMTVEALPGQTFQGIVYALDPQLDVNGRAVQLRATIPNPENVLKPGMFARVALTVSRKENALVIPESAIVPQGNIKQVFVVDAENKAQLVPVELGERLAGSVEVTSGLKAGDVVVTSGQIKLQPGVPVTNLGLTKQGGDAAAPADQAAPAPAEASAVAPVPATSEASPPADPVPPHEDMQPTTDMIMPAEPAPDQAMEVAPSEEPLPAAKEPASAPTDEGTVQ